jgi:hypothetical protein
VARRHFNAQFKQRGDSSTRNLKGLAAFVCAIYTARGISTSNFNGAAAFRRAIKTVGCISTRNLNGAAAF